MGFSPMTAKALRLDFERAAYGSKRKPPFGRTCPYRGSFCLLSVTSPGNLRRKPHCRSLIFPLVGLLVISGIDTASKSFAVA